jgi:osmotically-inducible protein OsmY
MRDFLSFAAGLATGAVFMYYLDKQSGARRRALVRDKVVAVGHDAADLAEAKAKRAADRVKGLLATGRLNRVGGGEPESDQQLHDRIRARLGRIVSHPKSIHVEANQGSVRLQGHVLTNELDDLLREINDMPGVVSIRNELTCHDTAQGIPELQGSTV